MVGKLELHGKGLNGGQESLELKSEEQGFGSSDLGRCRVICDRLLVDEDIEEPLAAPATILAVSAHAQQHSFNNTHTY